MSVCTSASLTLNISKTKQDTGVISIEDAQESSMLNRMVAYYFANTRRLNIIPKDLKNFMKKVYYLEYS